MSFAFAGLASSLKTTLPSASKGHSLSLAYASKSFTFENPNNLAASAAKSEAYALCAQLAIWSHRVHQHGHEVLVARIRKRRLTLRDLVVRPFHQELLQF